MRLKRTELAPVSSIDGYFRRILKDLVFDSPQASLLDEPAGGAAVDSQEERSSPLFESSQWLDERTNLIRSRLLELNDQQVKRLLSVIEVSLTKRGLYSISIAQNIMDCKWKKGRLLSEMINAFGQEHFGPEWNVKA